MPAGHLPGQERDRGPQGCAKQPFMQTRKLGPREGVTQQADLGKKGGGISGLTDHLGTLTMGGTEGVPADLGKEPWEARGGPFGEGTWHCDCPTPLPHCRAPEPREELREWSGTNEQQAWSPAPLSFDPHVLIRVTQGPDCPRKRLGEGSLTAKAPPAPWDPAGFPNSPMGPTLTPRPLPTHPPGSAGLSSDSHR